MPVYRYQALSRDGRLVEDEIELSDLRALYRYLREEGLTLVKYSTKTVFPWERVALSKLSRPELAEFCHNLALMVRGGVPLLQALKDLRASTTNPRLRRALGTLLQEIQGGRPLSQGMEREKGIFPGIVRSLTALGEETGRLDQTLEEAAQHLQRIHTIITQTKRAMLYPVLVLVAMTGALLFWLLFVLPKILDIFTQMQISLPWPTRMLLIFTFYFKHYFGYVALLLAGAIVVFVLAYRSSSLVRYTFEKLLLRLPLLSRIKRSSLLAFIFEYLALLLGAGIDILKSFDIMFVNLQSEVGKRIVKELREGVLRGESLRQVSEKIPLFNPLDLRMIGVGEETGRLVEQLRYLARYYYEVVQGMVETLSKILEPVLIVITGLIFLLIAISLIGPIYELISQIR
ncbi:type II secretion system F family protein [Thermosulfurimonas marina]|uniref:Type II secretion system F family protein n=1 Tax=Thermosulfurimonas marina TaxID=2047767 RepID=A0A6H1WQF1_9BACT|nr:type II secretion system F family protein [Thermosulfurimonas marina]QJA05421.1 type II secretion system F family protein [Thermosulfurimonas marina]